MKKLFLILFITSLLTINGCISYQVLLKTHLEKVTNNEIVTNISEAPFTYSDNELDIKIKNNYRDFIIDFKNKTNKLISIVWDKVSIVYPNGYSYRVFPSDKLLIDRTRSSVSSPIPPQSNVIMSFCPIQNIKYNYNNYYQALSGWEQQNIINETDKQKSDLINKYSYLIGEKFKIFIPICDSNNNIYKELLLQINIDEIEAR